MAKKKSTKTISNSIRIFINKFKYKKKKKKIYNSRPCSSTVNLTKLDAINFVDSVIGDFMDIVQYNGDNTNYANLSVVQTCKVMCDTAIGTPFLRLAKLNSLYMAGYGETCINFSYKTMIRELRQTSLTSSVADGGLLFLVCYNIYNQYYIYIHRSPMVLSGLQ